MYGKLQSSVQVNHVVTDVFECKTGTRQGCILSPFFFIFYLNEFIEMSKMRNIPGIYINEDYSDINMLLYADDLVLVADTIGRVQGLVNLLDDFCNKWGMKVNISKTKFFVYRNGGIIKLTEKCFINNMEIVNVPHYKYLGVLFSSRLSWSPAQSLLASQGSRAMYLINQVNYEYEFPYKASVELFNKCVLPIITYGSEIWGTKVHQDIERVQFKFCRGQLGVNSKTPIVSVLGECGRFPIFIECNVKVIKYWIKLLGLSNNTLLKASYNMLKRLSDEGRQNWAYDVKQLLYVNGFGYIWERQTVADPSEFIRMFKQRLKDSYIQTWYSAKADVPKLILYNVFKGNFSG